MSAELDRLADGTAAFASRKLTAWHREGTIFEDDLGNDIDPYLERGGVLYTVEKAPVMVSLSDGTLITSEDDAYALVRTDRNRILGTVGSTYAVLLNRIAFSPLRPLVEKGWAKMETVGTLREGRQAWALASFDVEAILAAAYERGDVSKETLEALAAEVLPYALLTNDFTGRAKARAKEVATRVVCANTFGMALSETGGMDIAVDHVGDVEKNFTVAAAILFNSVARRYGALAAKREILQAYTLDRVEYKVNVLDVVAPIDHLEAKVREGGSADNTAWTRTALEKALVKRNRIEALWTEGDGHTGDKSAWEAFQGFVQYADHEATSGDKLLALSDDGTLEKRKVEIGSRLMALATF